MSDVPFTDVYPDGPPGSAAAAGGGGPGSDTNFEYPGMPVGASPVHRDLEITAAGTYVLWDPGATYRFVMTSATLNVNAACRVAIVDENDVVGSRIVDVDLLAGGGATPNLVPVPYPSKLPGQRVRVVTDVVGNVKVHVAGWLQPA